jgi:peroxiredoxin
MRNSKRPFFLAVILSLMSVSLLSCGNVTAKVDSSASAPDFTLRTPGGESYNFYDNTKGKVVILTFWAQRCPPCRAKIPHLIELYSKYKDEGLEVIGIDVDASAPARMKDFMEEWDMNYTVLIGSRSDIAGVASSYGGIRFIPATFIIDRKGRIVERINGPGTPEQMEESIKELL